MLKTTATEESFGSNLTGMGAFLVDPTTAARFLFRRWFWIGPWLLLAVVSITASYFTWPIVQHVLEVAPTPPGADPAAVQKGAEMGIKMGRIAMYAAPITTLLLFAVQAGFLFGMAAVLSLNSKFMQFFNLVAGLSIIQALSGIATAVIIRAKTDVSTMAELRPALGLDLLLPEGTGKFVVAVLGYFSIFEIWWIVMAVLILGAAFRIGKGKALLIVLPLVAIGLTFRVAGAAFARS